MTLEIRIEPAAGLAEHASIRGVFESSSIFDPGALGESRELVEVALPAPIRKDYDELESPMQWVREFDVSKWILVSAFDAGGRVGGVLCAMETPGVDMLEGRFDLVVLWDVRVAPAARRSGVGSAMLHSAEGWARERGFRELKVETQNVNVDACRLYQRSGFTLSEVRPGAYPTLPTEVQLIWRKRIDV